MSWIVAISDTSHPTWNLDYVAQSQFNPPLNFVHVVGFALQPHHFVNQIQLFANRMYYNIFRDNFWLRGLNLYLFLCYTYCKFEKIKLSAKNMLADTVNDKHLIIISCCGRTIRLSYVYVEWNKKIGDWQSQLLVWTICFFSQAGICRKLHLFLLRYKTVHLINRKLLPRC